MYRAICVNDVDVSERFYCDALGFELQHDLGILAHPDLGKVLELPNVAVKAKLLKRRDGAAVKLLQFLDPLAQGERQKRSTLEYGLVHISFYVDDIDLWTARITASGGTVYEETRAYFAGNDTTLIYCTDPDGTRVELMKSPGEAERFSHGGICVDDISASMKFYQILGFDPAENYVLDGGFDWLGIINEVPGIKLRAQMMRNAEGHTIELLKVFEPDCFGSREKQPINRFGLTHLAFQSDNLEELLSQLKDAGGRHEPKADVTIGDLMMTHVIDRDGVRVELTQQLAAD